MEASNTENATVGAEQAVSHTWVSLFCADLKFPLWSEHRVARALVWVICSSQAFCSDWFSQGSHLCAGWGAGGVLQHPPIPPQPSVDQIFHNLVP